jgi:curved DNA-binding protein CbpA
LVEHNYYQLMQLDLYADASLVKRKYRELALLYHPDRNPKNKHSEEYFKVITQGYTILNEPARKKVYDELLRNYYQNRAQIPEHVKKKQTARERLRVYREKRRKEIIDDYVRSENEFPHKYRKLLAILVFLSGFLMCYNRWFINYLRFDIFFVIGGFIMFGLGCYLIANNAYRREAFKNALNVADVRVSARPVRMFMLLFFITPVLFAILVTVTRKVHLEHFYATTVVEKVSFVNDEVIYQYEVNGVEISRRTKALGDKKYNDKSRMRVRFSRINPNISELVLLGEPTD